MDERLEQETSFIDSSESFALDGYDDADQAGETTPAARSAAEQIPRTKEFPYAFSREREISLVNAARNGNPRALHKLVMSELAVVRDFAKGTSYKWGGVISADDLAQESLIKILNPKTIAKYEPREGKRLRQYFMRVADNAMRDQLRRLRARPATSLDDPVGGDNDATLVDLLPSPTMTPEQMAATHEELAIVSKIYDKLSPQQKIVIDALADGDGGTQISEDMGLDTGTIKTHTFRARKQFKAALEGERDLSEHEQYLLDYDFDEDKVNLADIDAKKIYRTALKALTPEKLYVFVAHRMYMPAERKTFRELAQELRGNEGGSAKSEMAALFELAAAKVRHAIPAVLRKYPVFSNDQERTGKEFRERSSAADIPAVEDFKLDLTTPERQTIYSAAKSLLTPYRLYVFCMNRLSKDEYRLNPRELAAALRQDINNITQTDTKAMALLKENLPEDLCASDVFQQRKQKNLKKIANSLAVPAPHRYMIDFSNPDVSPIWQAAEKSLSRYKLFIFTATRLYGEEHRLLKKQIAEKIMELNPDDPSLTLESVTARISVALATATRDVREALPDPLKNSSVLSQGPARTTTAALKPKGLAVSG